MHRRFGVLYLNWSGVVTFKGGHELITRGPCALVRHPIYTGLVTMFVATVIVLGRRRNHRDAVGVREHLDQTAARRKTHAPEIPRPIRCVSTSRETPDTFHHLAFSYMYEKNNCGFEDCSCFPGFESLAVASHPLQLISFLLFLLRDQLNPSKQKRD